MKQSEFIPLTLITGFLGSGKTTIIKKLLQCEELSKTDDLEFLWVARNTTNIVKNTSRDIKNFSDEKMARNIEGNGAIRLGDEVFVFNKSYAWKVHDLKNLINSAIKSYAG